MPGTRRIHKQAGVSLLCVLKQRRNNIHRYILVVRMHTPVVYSTFERMRAEQRWQRVLHIACGAVDGSTNSMCRDRSYIIC